MRMHSLSRRDRFYNQADAYQPVPAVRIPVVPGQSQETMVRLKMQSAAFSINVIGGATASLFLFYVPFRLLWDDWMQFISQDADYGGTFPVTSTNWNLVFDRGASPGNFSALYRRAYKLCYNQFFGQEGATNGWYADITADATVTEMNVLNTEQFEARMMLSGELQSPTYDATSVPIDLNDFYRQMQSARSQRKANMSGDKYVDALRRMGVEPDWRIQNAPEFIGRVDKDLLPVKTFNTTATGAGDSVARYEATIEHTFKRAMFAEHGFLVGIFTLRPHIYNNSLQQPPDAVQQSIEDFFLADNLRSQDEYDDALIGPGGGSFFTQRFAVYRNGIHMYGNGSTWLNSHTAGSVSEAMYPNGFNLPVGDELGGDGLAFEAQVHSVGQTPVPANSL